MLTYDSRTPILSTARCWYKNEVSDFSHSSRATKQWEEISLTKLRSRYGAVNSVRDSCVSNQRS